MMFSIRSLIVLIVLLISANPLLAQDIEDTGIPDSVYFLDPIVTYSDCTAFVDVHLPIYLFFDEEDITYIQLVLAHPSTAEFDTIIYSHYYGSLHHARYMFAEEDTMLWTLTYPLITHSFFPPHSGLFCTVSFKVPN